MALIYEYIGNGTLGDYLSGQSLVVKFVHLSSLYSKKLISFCGFVSSREKVKYLELGGEVTDIARC